jgi:two-component system chemotaxis response regulator CheY
MSQPLILVVEDDDAIRELLAELLEGEGYSVTSARHGQDALARLAALDRLPSLILLDLMMPVMNGEQFLQALREQLPQARAVPVYLLTAARGEISVPVTGRLNKPVDIDDVLAIAARHCGGAG